MPYIDIKLINETFEKKPLIDKPLKEIEAEVDKAFERRRAINSVLPAHLERRKERR